jgi:hypothetical protein
MSTNLLAMEAMKDGSKVDNIELIKRPLEHDKLYACPNYGRLKNYDGLPHN